MVVTESGNDEISIIESKIVELFNNPELILSNTELIQSYKKDINKYKDEFYMSTDYNLVDRLNNILIQIRILENSVSDLSVSIPKIRNDNPGTRLEDKCICYFMLLLLSIVIIFLLIIGYIGNYFT